MTKPRRIHVTFGESAAYSLRLAFGRLGIRERIVCLADRLELGPIAPVNTRRRARWLANELGHPAYGYYATLKERARRATSDPRATVVAWYGRNSNEEITGFLELLWRRRKAPTYALDVVDIDLGERPRAYAFSAIPDATFVELGFVDRPRLVDADAIAAARDQWRALRSENAPLRVVGPDGLVSALRTFFDERIVERTPDTWVSAARVVGDVLGYDAPYHNGNDSFLFMRILTLIDAGALEAQGDFRTFRTTYLRRPVRR